MRELARWWFWALLTAPLVALMALMAGVVGAAHGFITWALEAVTFLWANMGPDCMKPRRSMPGGSTDGR